MSKGLDEYKAKNLLLASITPVDPDVEDGSVSPSEGGGIVTSQANASSQLVDDRLQPEKDPNSLSTDPSNSPNRLQSPPHVPAEECPNAVRTRGGSSPAVVAPSLGSKPLGTDTTPRKSSTGSLLPELIEENIAEVNDSAGTMQRFQADGQLLTTTSPSYSHSASQSSPLSGDFTFASHRTLVSPLERPAGL